MKYSLKWYHWAGRELTCLLKGHKWIVSPSRKTQYYDVDQDEVPYDVRCRTGNYMWESIASWEEKCVRCRKRMRSWARWGWQPFHVTLWNALQGAAWDSKFWFRMLFIKDDDGLNERPLWRRIVFGVPFLIVNWMQHVYIYFENAPEFVLMLLCDTHEWLYERFDTGN